MRLIQRTLLSTIFDHEVADDHLEIELGTIEVDHEVADDESRHSCLDLEAK